MKKKCLLIIPRTIHPIIGGYSMSHFNLMRILNEKYHLTVVVLAETELTDQGEQFYKSNSDEFHYFRFSKWRYMLNALFGVLSSKPIQVKYYWFRKVNKTIKALIDQNDILVAGLVRSMEYVKNAPSSKIIVFNMADSYAINYNTAKDKTTSPIWKMIYSVEAKRLMKYEQKSVERADVTYLFNQEERNYWSQYGNVIRAPHGVNDILFTYDKKDPKYANSVVFIGKMDYQPNIEAAKWYVENVHTKIGDQIPFVIVGAKPSNTIIELSKLHPNIEITGFVEDAYLYVKSAMLVVAPMQTGSGIQNKVLEAMALGKLNIISTIAANPIIGAQDGQHFVIADSPEQYAEKILSLKDNPGKCREIGEKGSKLIFDNYTWDSYASCFIAGIEDEIAENKTRNNE